MTTLWDFVHEVGIRPYRDGHLREEYLSIPLRYRRLSGLPLDEALDEAVASGLLPPGGTESDLIARLRAGKSPEPDHRVRLHDEQPRCSICGRFMSVYDTLPLPHRFLATCSRCRTVQQPRCPRTGQRLSWVGISWWPLEQQRRAA
jgi:hypothetical protein